MKFPAYAAYQDSGIDWIGAVPAHWNVVPFKTQIERNDGGVWGADPDGETDTIVLRSTEQTVDGRWRIEDPAPRKLTVAEIEAALLIEGDLLLTKSSGSALHIGKTTLVDRRIAALRCCYSNFMQRIRLKGSFLPELAWYVLNNDLARLQFDLLSNSTTGLANLNGTMIGQIIVTVPPPAEQSAIAAFLDRETGKIDALVAEQERLIALLKEKREAVISHAVTKGLDASAPMKDSGVAWLGQVPAHWKVERARHLFVERDERSEGGDETLLTVSHLTGVTPRSEKTVYMIEAETTEGYKLCYPGDLVINTLWAWMGAMGVTDVAGLISPAYNVYTPCTAVDPAYVNAIARMPEFARESSRWSKGVWSSRLRLYPAEFFQIQMPVPPVSEQREIWSLIDDTTARFDTLTKEAHRAIALLRERRAALISAAVTGKIDVRGLAAATREGIAA